MTSKDTKKRKYEQENRTFQKEWFQDFAFIDNKGKSLCLICKTTIANYKVSNLRRHYQTHSEFSINYPPNSNVRNEKLQSLQTDIQRQQGFLSSFNKEDVKLNEASFLLAWNIARAKRPYGEGEFIKQNLEEVIKILDPDNKKLHKLIAQVPISRRTTERRIGTISKNIENTLICELKNCTAFSLAVDESTDMQDIPQLSIFVRYVSEDFIVKEELLDLVALVDTTRGVDVRNALDGVMQKFELSYEKLVSVATDGAPVMVGEHKGLIGLLKTDIKIPRFIPLHCIIHREHLVAKYFKYENVWKIVLQIVNFIRANAKTHRQFKSFVEELQLNDDTEEIPNDLSLWCIVRWLSTFNVLNRFVELLNHIKKFLKDVKGKNYPLELDNDMWLSDLMFFTDILEHLQALNLALQGKDKNIIDLSQTLLSFESKIRLFVNDLKNHNFNHFPRLKVNITNIKEEKIDEYKERLENLRLDLQNRFEDIKSLKSSFSYFINPFICDIIEDGFQISEVILADKASAELELLEMKEDQALKTHHKTSSTLEFWNLVPKSKYPHWKKAACRLFSIFGTTYCCESLFSTMKHVKSKHRSQLTNEHLTQLLRTALTNFTPNYQELAKSIN